MSQQEFVTSLKGAIVRGVFAGLTLAAALVAAVQWSDLNAVGDEISIASYESAATPDVAADAPAPRSIQVAHLD